MERIQRIKLIDITYIGRETLDTIAAQKGCTNSYYGGTLEDEGVLIWCIGLFSPFIASLTDFEYVENSPVTYRLLFFLFISIPSTQTSHELPTQVQFYLYLN